jgi:asparagine synthase (glutamine-hydrolysing)
VCGIVGRFTWEGPLEEDALRGAVDLLAHRGPDESAFWADDRFFLGHRRLSIIDLSSGQQPMGTTEGELVVTFNGEIYNYAELRDELRARGHRFRTSSDTEVLLEGYREWGTGLPDRLVGMFAFVIADRERRELFLARDPFGEKPLLYVDGPGAVTFASELRALVALGAAGTRIDLQALGGFLCLNYVPGEATLLANVRRVPPGTWRLYRNGRASVGRYWHARAGALPAPASREEALEGLRGRLDEAVKRALVSDVPVGIFLSGGMDSSLVAESAARQGCLSRAYCLDFDEAGYSEWPRAERVARRLEIPITRVRLGDDAASDFLRLVEHADDPLADSSSLPVWAISREAARTNKVVLGGDGGDELFGGYLTYKASLLHARVAAALPLAARRLVARSASWVPTREGKVSTSYRAMRFARALDLPSGEAHFTWNGTWLPREAERLLRVEAARDAARDALRALAERHRLPARPDLTDLQRADIAEYLPNDILAKVDRMSMAHGLEVRAPFLQREVADFALSLPTGLRCAALGRPKRLLRELARRIYGPEIADAPKQGFSIPVHGWLRERLRDVAEDLLSAESLEPIDEIDGAAVRRVWRDHLAGRSYGWEVWGLMVLSAWHRSRVRSRPGPVISGTGPIRRHLPDPGLGARPMAARP